MHTPLQLPCSVRRKETGNGSNGVEPADRIAVAIPSALLQRHNPAPARKFRSGPILALYFGRD